MLEEWQGMHHVFVLNTQQLASARRALDHDRLCQPERRGDEAAAIVRGGTVGALVFQRATLEFSSCD